jgi:hypothetical protein
VFQFFILEKCTSIENCVKTFLAFAHFLIRFFLAIGKRENHIFFLANWQRYIYIPLPICQKGDLAKITREKSEILGFKYLLFNILQILSSNFHLHSHRLLPTADFSGQN